MGTGGIGGFLMGATGAAQAGPAQAMRQPAAQGNLHSQLHRYAARSASTPRLCPSSPLPAPPSPPRACRIQAGGVSRLLLRGQQYSAPPNLAVIEVDERWRSARRWDSQQRCLRWNVH